MLVKLTEVGSVDLVEEGSVNCARTERVETNPVLTKVHLLLHQTDEVKSDIVKSRPYFLMRLIKTTTILEIKRA